MKSFKLQKSSGSNHAVVKFDVIDPDGTICGRICVPVEDASDLAKHWLGSAQPQASAFAQKENAMASALQASKRDNTPAAPPARPKDQSQMISAMVDAAPKHPLSRTAILRGC